MPPKKRIPKTHAPEWGYCGLTHLQLGDCLLAGPGHGCDCRILRPDGFEDLELARRWWRENKVEVLRDWKGPGLCWAEEKFGR